MKATAIFFSLMLFTYSALACDESCLREKAESTHNIKFSSYIDWEYCESARDEFLTDSIASLEKYSTQYYDVRNKGGMNNIKKYIENRIDWIQECNSYLYSTGKGPIFDNIQTTNAIMHSLTSVTLELGVLINGSTYSSDTGADTDTVIQEKFRDLFTKVADHRNLMYMEGRYANR